VVDFIGRERANLARSEFYKGGCLAVKCGKLDKKILASLIDMNDGTHIARGKAVFRHVLCQSYAIEFSEHVAEDRP
jgi:hypothetical protein